MPLADTQKNVAELYGQPGLRFRHLPAYARFLLDHKLEKFVAASLRISQQLDVPLLRYFKAWPEEQLMAMGMESNTRLLTAIIQGKVNDYLEESLRSWKDNQLPIVQSDDIVIEDISKVNFIRRQVFRQFLSEYSPDPQVYVAIMDEVDFFTLTGEESYYKTLFELKEEKIREHHHFIDKIADTTPGILYVFDVLEQRQIYANHKQEEALGYTSGELSGLDSTRIMSELVHPDDKTRLSEHYREFSGATEGEIRTVEYRVRHRDGSYIWQRGYEAVFKRSEAGRPCEIIGIAIDVSKEKEASIQLEQREAQLREAQEVAGMGSFEWDLAGHHSVFSPHLFKIFEMEGASNLMAFLEYVHPSDRQLVKDAIETAINGSGIYECEYRYRRNGREKIIWSRGKVSFEDGKAVKMKGTVMDITQRHDMIKRLERSEQLHKQAQALTHLGNWSWMLADDRVDWSDEMYRIFGLQPQSEPMTLSRILSLVHPDDRADRYDALHRAVKTTHADDYTMRVITEDGTLKVVEGKTEVLVDERGRPYKVVGTCQDITRQHLLNEQIRENEEASSQLINNAPEAIVVIDDASTILLWNPKAELTFGWSFDEVRGKSLTDTIIPVEFRHHHIAGVNRLLATGVSRVLNKTIEVTALKKSGEVFYISLTVSRSVRAGRPVFIAFVRDISNEKATERKLMEQRSQLAQKNRELERNNNELMAYNYIASHDLQEPVRKIQVFSNLIMANEAESLPQSVRSSVERIMTAANHMHRLIDALIAFSRTSGAERAFELADLDILLGNVRNLLRDKIEELGAVIRSSPLPVLRVIPFQIQQLFENIISNALKYCRPGVPPLVDISAEIVAGSSLQGTGVDPEQDYCRLTIADNGIGFDQQYATKVFELFQRLHKKNEYSGTGIGLAICKKIVQNHDGHITARSLVGEGTAFDIFLPVQPEEAAYSK
jgi:PAS domain S-box-containing protein